MSRSRTPEYRAWLNMRYRCEGRTPKHVEAYRDRGITVCGRWFEGDAANGWDGYAYFLADVGLRPTPKHEIDRIDNDGNYEPGNCRWATRTEQNRNKRDTRKVVYRGRYVSVAEAREMAGNVVGRALAYTRLRRGWPTKDAVETADSEGCGRWVSAAPTTSAFHDTPRGIPSSVDRQMDQIGAALRALL